MADKYTAVWVSHSSLSDFLKCPRSYYLKNVYRQPSTGHKIKLMSPPLALGQVVHEVIESLSNLPKEKRFAESLVAKLETAWQKVSGRQGGFVDEASEAKYKKRGALMLERVTKHPGPLKNLAVKIQMNLPYFWLSEEANIILCGKIDWLEYLKDEKAVHIIDFKTNVSDESADSLQLPIYYLLASRCQKFPVVKMSYWYLERQDEPQAVDLPDGDEVAKKIIGVAKQIKTARQLNVFKCPHHGCYACRPMEAIIKGEAEWVGTNSFNDDVYILEKSTIDEKEGFATKIL